jgi:hypothetical protein
MDVDGRWESNMGKVKFNTQAVEIARDTPGDQGQAIGRPAATETATWRRYPKQRESASIFFILCAHLKNGIVFSSSGDEVSDKESSS